MRFSPPRFFVVDQLIILLSFFLISQSSVAEPEFLALKNQLEKFGFQVIIALPPLKDSPQQNIGGNPPLPRPYGLS
jgi:hypothetical protein